VGPRAVLDAVVKRKIPNPRRESNPSEFRLYKSKRMRWKRLVAPTGEMKIYF
jgi:hypothetical protein